jgi:hypothetical protein
MTRASLSAFSRRISNAPAGAAARICVFASHAVGVFEEVVARLHAVSRAANQRPGADRCFTRVLLLSFQSTLQLCPWRNQPPRLTTRPWRDGQKKTSVP